jgi:hypothetical protein
MKLKKGSPRYQIEKWIATARRGVDARDGQ